MSGQKITQAEAEERERIGATMRQLREARHVSLDELASAVGVSRPYLSNIELGRKPLTPVLLGRIADVLDVRAISIVRPNYFPASDPAVAS